MEGPKDKKLIDDELKALISEIVSEAVSKAVKESLSVIIKELKDERSRGIEKEIKRVAKVKNGKIVESKIYDLIKEKGMLLSDLKFLIVDQLNYCSKASFYRHIENLKNKGLVLISGRGKNNFIVKQLYNEQTR